MTYQNKLNAAINFGLLVNEILEDEAIHRVGTQIKPKSKNGWYLCYTDCLIMGDWGTGASEVWKPEGQKKNHVDVKRIKAAIERDKQQRLIAQEQAALAARQQHRTAQKAVSHPYLSAKSINATRCIKVSGQWLLVPLYDLKAETLMNLQRIAHDGTKRFLKGGRITGMACPIGLVDEQGNAADKSLIYICEGYATAASLNQITKTPVIAAMNASNLLAVTKAVKAKWPSADLVIAGDDDWLTEQKIGTNIGRKKANEAAQAFNAKVSFPPFTLDHKKAGLSDWNDYYTQVMNKAAA